MTARDEILGRIGALSPATTPAGIAAEYAAIARPYLRRHHTARAGEILDLFAERTAQYRATVHRVTAARLPADLTVALREGRYAVPEGLPTEWLGAPRDGGTDRFRIDPTVAELDELSGVITGCAVAVAETGTIVLDHRRGQGPRALTLVPDHHLIVVTADQVAPDVPEALERLDPARPLTFISGPSATSDIELSRVEGVHGPRTLEVFLVS